MAPALQAWLPVEKLARGVLAAPVLQGRPAVRKALVVSPSTLVQNWADEVSLLPLGVPCQELCFFLSFLFLPPPCCAVMVADLCAALVVRALPGAEVARRRAHALPRAQQRRRRQGAGAAPPICPA